LPDYLALNTFVAFDLETTGFDLQIDKITEIGAVKIVNGKITETFTTLINPQMPISKEITRLTGIDDKMVKNAPAIKDVVPDFFRFCFGASLIAHNIDFDHRFITKAALDGGGGIKFGNTLIDTLKMARNGLKGLNNYKLNTIAERLKIDLGTHHRALSDANTCAEICINLIKLENNACKKSTDVI
jgi:DNA polymerase-3 subunit alpha (Gram-positive type)